MTIDDIVRRRSITEILHYTTNGGITGIFAVQAVKPRKRLPTDKYLEHIYKAVCADRTKDAAWHDYVNLSITSINSRLFSISANNWHRNLDGWWCILAFRPTILTHPGVWFTTTNNIYTGVQRAMGADGLEAMFAPKIVRWLGNVAVRSTNVGPAQPTCVQAEVLYPGELLTTFLERVYVRDAHDQDAIGGMLSAMSLKPIECVVAPEYFA